jgi:hypothetical protein
MQETALIIYSKYFKRTVLSDAACWSTKSEKKNTVKISRNYFFFKDLEINVCKQMQNGIKKKSKYKRNSMERNMLEWCGHVKRMGKHK